MPVDIHISKGDVHRLAKTIILASVKSRLFNHHKVHMMPGAGAGVIHLRDFHALPNIRASDLYTLRDTIFRNVEVDLVGPGVGGAVLQGDAVGAARVAVITGVAPMIHKPTFCCR